MKMPEMIKIKQVFKSEHIEDIECTVKEQMQSTGIAIKKGANIAIACGSRGIANIHIVAKAAVEWVKSMGGNPFIVPAMGSHGGATAEGQKQVLEGYGITEEYVGAPIKSSLQVVELPSDGLINKVYMDKYAYEADGTIIINRIKLHTDFHGTFESGLMKMCVIGLGKHKQALEIHRHRIYGLKELIPPTARQVLKHGNIIMGIGLVENAYDKTAIIKAVKPEELELEELKLIETSRKLMPSLPIDSLDVLIIDEMGKNISGVGMDSNIIGRMKIKGEDPNQKPDITHIVVTDLTEESHGNALGVGIADVTTRKLFDKIDLKATYENVVTSTFLDRGKIPIIADTDKQAVDVALRTCGPVDTDTVKMARIKNTLHIGELYVSEAVLKEIQSRENIKVVGEFKSIFDSNGNLVEF